MKIMKKLAGGLSYFPFFFTGSLLASNTAIDLNPGYGFNFLGTVTIPSIITAAIQIFLVAAAVVALIFLIIGGIKWITSGGDKAAVESARNTITSALIGLVVVFAAWAITKLIQIFFNIEILSNLTLPQVQP